MTHTIQPGTKHSRYVGTMKECSVEVAAAGLINTYQKILKDSQHELMKIECKLTGISDKVTVTVRNNFKGLFADLFDEKGFIEYTQDNDLKLKKKKFSIKIKASDSGDAYPLALLLLKYFKGLDLMQHSTLCIVENKAEETKKIQLSLNEVEKNGSLKLVIDIRRLP